MLYIRQSDFVSMLEEENREFRSHAISYCPYPQAIRFDPRCSETVAGEESTGQRLQITEDVSILRVDYSTIQAPLFRVWKAVEARLVQGIDALTRIEEAVEAGVRSVGTSTVFG
jgi:hypothetical protein